jgi:C-terminal processing protease CtpA/Prc
MMKSLPNVTTVGMPTRGASGNPNAMPLARTGLMVYYSSWVDMLPNGKTFEGVGIPPDIRVDLPTAAYATADPTLEKGLEVLRSKVAAAR